jgi:hypothetical protein
MRVQVDDNDELRKVLDIFMASSEVTMDFVVNAGGKVVKALRGSQDEQVRKKAIELTAVWKTLVAGQLADAEKKKGGKKKQEVKEEDAERENEAGEADVSLACSCEHAPLSVYGKTPQEDTARDRQEEHVVWGLSCRAAGTWRKNRAVCTRPSFKMHIVGRETSRCKSLCCKRGSLSALVKAAVITLLTRSVSVSCYPPHPPAPHHFFAAGAARPACSAPPTSGAPSHAPHYS